MMVSGQGAKSSLVLVSANSSPGHYSSTISRELWQHVVSGHESGMSPTTPYTMKIRAAQAGQSLQAYLRGLIEKEAAKPTVAEAVEQARREATANISTADVLEAIDDGRAGPGWLAPHRSRSLRARTPRLPPHSLRS
jgi:hypothetical protein